MRRLLFSLLLASSACGARTGLDLETASRGDGGVKLDAEAGADADAAIRTDAGMLLCPLTPPVVNTSCPAVSFIVQCSYLASESSVGLTPVCCEFGTWNPCVIVADQNFTCSSLVCTTGTYEECIIDNGRQCCTCSADGTVDQCGPC
jgi:hypothetical protein